MSNHFYCVLPERHTCSHLLFLWYHRSEKQTCFGYGCAVGVNTVGVFHIDAAKVLKRCIKAINLSSITSSYLVHCAILAEAH